MYPGGRSSAGAQLYTQYHLPQLQVLVLRDLSVEHVRMQVEQSVPEYPGGQVHVFPLQVPPF